MKQDVCQHGGLRRKCDICQLEADNAQLQAKLDKVTEASQAVINRWDSPHWKWDDEHTGDKINRLRIALAETTNESPTNGQ